MFSGNSNSDLDVLFAELISAANETSVVCQSELGFSDENITQHLYPIGPAPEGWERLEGCSRCIPHDECNEVSENEEMNSEHYTN
jgi:hypothetical protein